MNKVEVEITGTSIATTISGNKIKIDNKTTLYLLEETDIKFIISNCIDAYKEKETHFWALMLLIGLIIGVLIG